MKVLTEKFDFPDRNVRSFLEVFELETRKRTVLRAFDHLIEAPNWTKGGEALVYNAGGRLYRYGLADGEINPIDTGYAVTCNNDHVLSPDGTKIAVSHMTAEDFQSRVYIVPIEGGRPELITPIGPSYLHGWSPDGSTLAYCAERNGNYNVYSLPVHGGEEQRLTFTEGGLDDGCEYSPDGKHIWFNSVRTGLMQIWRMNADGSEPTQMTFGDDNAWFPHVSPDGAHVVYLVYRKRDLKPHEHLPNLQVELRRMNYDGSGTDTLCTLFGGQGTINVNSWSPCSKKFAFVRYEEKS